MTVSDVPLRPQGASTAPGVPLVPLLSVEGGAPDPVALATWHLALSATTAVEVPHDLFAVWLYPFRGGALLLGPEALAADRVEVPIPSPFLAQDQLFELEQVLRRAQYLSALAVPVRTRERDVGVMLLGAFARGAYGPLHAISLGRLAAGLSGPFQRLADVIPAAAPHDSLEPVVALDALPEAVALAAVEAENGPDLVRRVSGLLYSLLPHDRLEILVAGANVSTFVPLSGQAARRRWSAAGGGKEPFADIVSRFGAEATLLVDDMGLASPDAEWSLGGETAPTQAARGVLGARLMVAGETVGYLCLASVAREAYRPEDEETLAAVARLLAPRVGALRLAAELEGARALAPSQDGANAPLLRAIEALGHEGHLGAALADFSSHLGLVLPHARISLALRRGEEEVIMLDPDALRPLVELPPVQIEEHPGALVLRGERGWVVRSVDQGEEVIVPLIVAGRIIGALGIQGASFVSTRDAAALARPFAEVLAPHLELLRRGAAPLPFAQRERSPVR